MRRFAFLFFVAGFAGGLLALWAARAPGRGAAADLFPSLEAAAVLPEGPGPAALSARMEQVAAAVRPSVVSVRVVQEGHDPIEDLFPGFRTRRGPLLVRGQGSGVVIDAAGLVVTNRHVVENARAIGIGLPDGRMIQATGVVGTDPLTDLALFRVPARDLVPIRMGDSDALRVGQIVLAVGSPYGLDQTVTQGIVSAKGRSLRIAEDVDFLQTDAAINGGNSGGALVDLEGRLVGINTAILSGGGGFQGIGFAIPVNTVQDVVHQLLQNGRVVRGALGVVMQELSREERAAQKPPGGVRIVRVMPDSPAERAGLKPGDVILRFDGKPVEDGRQLRRLVSLSPVDARRALEIVRDGARKGLEARIGQMTPSPEPAGE